MQPESRVPVHTAAGVELLPLARTELPSWRVAVVETKAHLIENGSPSNREVRLQAVSAEEAVGLVLTKYGRLCFDDILFVRPA